MKFGLLKTILAEKANRLSRWLLCRENISTAEFQYWLDHNASYTRDNRIERIKLIKRLNPIGGTNGVFLAEQHYESNDGSYIGQNQEIVIKICIPYAPRGARRHDQINMIHSSFQDEIRVNNLIRTTNIEGVVAPLGAGWAGRLLFLKMEYIRGNSLDYFIKTDLGEREISKRLAQMAYLANTLSQLHYYRVFHLDLKPKNLILVQDPNCANYGKILIFDFGFANSQLRETVNSFGGMLTPLYSAPEQALMMSHLSHAADYFSFGCILHEYLTGYSLYPNLMNVFQEDNQQVSERYMNELRDGRVNRLKHLPQVAEFVDECTIFDSATRLQQAHNLFDIAHTLKDLAKSRGFEDTNTRFLDNQLQEYHEQNMS